MNHSNHTTFASEFSNICPNFKLKSFRGRFQAIYYMCYYARSRNVISNFSSHFSKASKVNSAITQSHIWSQPLLNKIERNFLLHFLLCLRINSSWEASTRDTHILYLLKPQIRPTEII